MPPDEVRQLRSLVAHRRRMVKQRTQVRNRLRGVLFRHNLMAAPDEVFGPSERPWWEALALPASEKLQVRHDLAILNHLQPLVTETDHHAVPQAACLVAPSRACTFCFVRLCRVVDDATEKRAEKAGAHHGPHRGD